ncbi:DnaA regulatory inactivator Hda [Defluviimonas aquaemixtae]|uniref:DnaA regulatory inactivator Hda n=1 Tax=Albidovulum aquaemixtae TaxID=1542388 RepID=A0A2R8B7G2_9RHOB|nr:chromosomal replication initiator DnaA [Defluviimonas aquaemixtae]SPH18510.1 DnaA regulatory inactivator Hda [Defluviimonas aquaemixtae]
MTRQLTLDLPVRPALGREDFFVSPSNELAVATLDRGDWPGGKLLLIGPAGSGKSHLAQVWAGAESAGVFIAEKLLDGLPDARAIVVEDVDRIAGDKAAETQLFHLHNHAQAHRIPLLMTARSAPTRWGLVLPDLASRLEATALATLLPPDDALLAAVLVKLFSDRQISVAPLVVERLLPRIDRSFAGLHRLVAALDAAALSRKRPITWTIASEVLDTLSPETP